MDLRFRTHSAMEHAMTLAMLSAYIGSVQERTISSAHTDYELSRRNAELIDSHAWIGCDAVTTPGSHCLCVPRCRHEPAPSPGVFGIPSSTLPGT